MALVDTNCDPDVVDHIIACNDDALKCIKLIVNALAEVVIDKKKSYHTLFLSPNDLL